MIRERWAMVFEPLDDAIPAAVRVRRLLKFALRGLRLKCVRLGGDAESQRIEPPVEPQAPARPPPPKRGF